jgi:hypothetical protein
MMAGVEQFLLALDSDKWLDFVNAIMKLYVA